MSLVNPSDTIGNRTRDLPAGSAVPQRTAPPPILYSVLVLRPFRVATGNAAIAAAPTCRELGSTRFVRCTAVNVALLFHRFKCTKNVFILLAGTLHI